MSKNVCGCNFVAYLQCAFTRFYFGKAHKNYAILTLKLAFTATVGSKSHYGRAYKLRFVSGCKFS